MKHNSTPKHPSASKLRQGLTGVWLAGVTALASTLAGCLPSDSSSGPTNTELDVALKVALNSTVVPAYEDLAAQALSLDTLSEAFCADKTAANLTAAQTQWKTTQAAWFTALPFNFGPSEIPDSSTTPAYWYIDSYRVRGINELSTVRSDITNMLASSDAISDATFSTKTYTKVGLVALESLLFETADTGHSTVSNDIVTEYANSTDNRKCLILTGHSAELLRRANAMSTGWTTDYRGTGQSYLDLLTQGTLDTVLDDESGSDVMTKITVAAQGLYDYFGKRDVTTQVASVAGNVWDAVAASLDATEELLEGHSQDAITLFALMTKRGNSQDVETVRANIATLRTTITNQNTTEFQAAASVLDGNFKREIPDALDLSLGLNFSDGD